MTTVVLGWDGLDYDRAQEFDVAETFGPHHSRIETFENEHLGTPHTLELWPSIITGERPDVHGIHAADPTGGLDWSNSVLDELSTAAQHVIPAGIREQIGLVLRNAGAEVDHVRPEYYADEDVQTVFDDRRALPLAIPNYHTDVTDRHGLVVDRGADLQSFLTIEERDGKTVHVPDVPIHEYEARLVSEAMKKLGLVRSAVERDYDLVFVWLGYLDSVGHIAPVADDDSWPARAYTQAAEWTRALQEAMPAEDTLLTVSDHGLKGGEHTHAAFVGADASALVERTDSVLDVADAIDAVTSRSGDGTPAVRNQFRTETTAEDASADDVREQLESLGYIDA
jgi:hypothetical protein